MTFCRLPVNVNRCYRYDCGRLRSLPLARQHQCHPSQIAIRQSICQEPFFFLIFAMDLGKHRWLWAIVFLSMGWKVEHFVTSTAYNSPLDSSVAWNSTNPMASMTGKCKGFGKRILLSLALPNVKNLSLTTSYFQCAPNYGIFVPRDKVVLEPRVRASVRSSSIDRSARVTFF